MSEQQDIPKITMWRGRDVRELSRDELIEAVTYISSQLQSQLEANIKRSRMRAAYEQEG